MSRVGRDPPKKEKKRGENMPEKRKGDQKEVGRWDALRTKLESRIGWFGFASDWNRIS